MSDPYLIAHIVRGSPAFDIAIRMCSSAPCQPSCGLWDGETCKAEDWWIIPTSGHRAYPYWHAEVIDLLNWLGGESGYVSYQMAFPIPPPPDDWPDHYQSSIDSSPISPSERLAVGSLIERLGLAKPKEPIKRRI